MKQYQITGLSKTTRESKSYETDSSSNVLRDEKGYGIEKMKRQPRYIFYAISEEGFPYEIHLYKVDLIAHCGKICYIGRLKIERTKHTHDPSSYTHVPITPLFICETFKEKMYDDSDSDAIDVYVRGEPDVLVFQYSCIGGNGCIPRGYARVNMELFEENPKYLR